MKKFLGLFAVFFFLCSSLAHAADTILWKCSYSHCQEMRVSSTIPDSYGCPFAVGVNNSGKHSWQQVKAAPIGSVFVLKCGHTGCSVISVSGTSPSHNGCRSPYFFNHSWNFIKTAPAGTKFTWKCGYLDCNKIVSSTSAPVVQGCFSKYASGATHSFVLQ